MTTAAQRVKRFRDRQREGKAVISIEVDLVDHTELLIASGLLAAWADHDRSSIEAATTRLLRALAAESVTRNEQPNSPDL